jgi:lipid-A-disaccharide synthase
LPVDLHVGRTPEVIEAADCCLMVSGSVSLEMLARRTPAVVLYRAGPLMYVVARMLGTCNYISLPNLIADRPVMPEFPCLLSSGSHVREMIRILDGWLGDPDLLRRSREELDAIADGIVEAGGVARAADVLAGRLTGHTPAGEPLRGPKFPSSQLKAPS